MFISFFVSIWIRYEGLRVESKTLSWNQISSNFLLKVFETWYFRQYIFYIYEDIFIIQKQSYNIYMLWNESETYQK